MGLITKVALGALLGSLSWAVYLQVSGYLALLDFNRTLFETYDKTFQVISWGRTIIRTIEPKTSIIRAVLSLRFDAFGTPTRYGGSSSKKRGGNIVEGPRICPPRQMVYTESAYLIIILLLELSSIGNQDLEPWTEHMRMTVQSKNGVKVKMMPNRQQI